MIKISALNDESASGQSMVEIATQEAQEEAAFELYNRGLEFLNENHLAEADDTFREIVRISVTTPRDSCQTLKDSQKKATSSQSLLLVYSAYKNLANIAIKRKDYTSAMESYLEAVTIDSSDVTLWFRIGTTALKIHRYSLASLAFQEALTCNTHHWPSLENIITVLYVLNDYSSCLFYIAQVLQKDSSNVKGLAFRDQIFREHPGLRRDTMEYFSECDDSIYSAKYDREEGQQLIDSALEMRNTKKKLSRPTPPPVLHFVKPLNEKKTWKNLGECLVDLYNLISQASRPISFSCKLNLSKYLTVKESIEQKSQSSSQEKEDISVKTEIKDSLKPSDTDIATEQAVETVAVPAKAQDHDIEAVAEAAEAISVTQSEQNVQLEISNSKKSRKRKSFPFEFIDAASKRRSTRVRNTLTKKEPDNVNFAELLQSFLPSSLLTNNDDVNAADGNSESTGESENGSASNNNREANTDKERNVKHLNESEEQNVFDFLKSCVANTGVLDVLYRYLMNLIDHQHKLWPPALINIYIDAYSKVREHITHPSLFCQDRESCDVRDEGIMTLCYCEFKLDKCLSNKINLANGPAEGFDTSAAYSLNDINDRHFSVDLVFLNQLSLRTDILENFHLEFCVRVLWLRARLYVLQTQSEMAVDCFERIVELLKEPTAQKTSFILINCAMDNEISLEHITKQLESLQQSKSFDDLNLMFAAGEYQNVVDLLVTTFSDKDSLNKTVGSTKKLHDRHFLLLLLQEALCSTGDRQQWLLWGEASLNEAWEMISQSTTNTSKQILSGTITEILVKLELCVSKESSVVHTLPPTKLKRLINTVVQIIVHEMQTPSHVTEMPFKTNAPWIILYLIIQQEEEKIKSLMMKKVASEDGNLSESNQQDSENCSESEFGPGMPSSLMLLYSAHEYLGRRGWCCASDGALLLFYSNVLLQELKKSTVNNPHPYKEDLDMSIEQCFFCLYGHPNKKTKAKYLQEHGAHKITLTWDRAVSLFEYFKPRELPGFDSVKTVSISAELECLLKRIYALISPEDDTTSKLESMRSYIDGEISEIPVFLEFKEKAIIKDLYYLLADYYFKNNEQGKAIKFYLLDICVNQDRLDSWAGIALAKSSQLEQRLNSCDIKYDGTIYQKAAPVLRCFQRALQLDPAAANLWIEYGALTYMLHSYTCRHLKQQSHSELGADVLQMLTSKRNEMLATSKQCFESAIECENGVEEEWLLHYMLGKIAEKMGNPIKEYLNHYKLAAKHLYMEGARYPKKIQYHNPPNLALEALEVYYRIHSSIMKFLLKRESTILDSQTYETLESYLNDAAEGHFVKFQEKRHDSQNTSDGDDSVQLPDECMKPKKINPFVNDHDYYKRKRKALSQDQSSYENRQKTFTDSQDNAAVADLINSLVLKVSEEVNIIESSSSEKISKDVNQGEAKYSMNKDQGVSDSTGKSTKATADQSDLDTEVKSKAEPAPSILSPKSAPSRSGGVNSGAKDTVGHRALILRCEEALRQCLQRFPQHYKSLYRLAHYYYASRFRKNVQWSWDYLLGPQTSWNQCAHMCSPALFSERKNTNFFNGIWRIPIDEIDRSGCFATHMYRSISLVVDVLVENGDHSLMVHLALQLHRNPDAGKKYLRDVDRLCLAKRACDESVYLLLKKMRQLCREESTPVNQTRVIHHLLLLFRAWQNFQKVVSDFDAINDLLIKAFCIFRRGQIDPSLPVLDQAIRFCQQQQSIIKLPLTPTSLGEPPLFPTAVRQPKATNPPSEDAGASHTDVWPSNTAKQLPVLVSEGLPIHQIAKASGGVGQTKSSAESGISSGRSINSNLHPIRSPNLLTADVQSKIKSLDPVCDTYARPVQQMSGFQLEFLRQISSAAVVMKPAKVVKSCSTEN